MKNTVLLDLGGTLVHYFEHSEFPGILREAVAEVESCLRQQGLMRIRADILWQNVKAEDHESPDYRVRPLEERLASIFQVDRWARSGNLLQTMCRLFMKPIFARARLYPDALPTLQELKSRGLKTAIVSNTTWGSPATLWREELDRHGLSKYLDVAVFCRDVGWRKPAKQIFEFALEKLASQPVDCIFVGDDPRWDVAGPEALGMEAVLIDRRGVKCGARAMTTRNLYELLRKVHLA